MISAVVLAVERAPHADTQTLFLPLTAKPLPWILESVLAAKVDEVICVTADLAAARREIKFISERVLWCVNPAASQGQSTSVIAGLWASHPQSDGVMFLAGDQPLVRKELINSLIERFEQTAASIVAGSSAGKLRGPVLFRRDLFPELLKLTGDDGGHSLLEKYPEKTSLVEWQEETSFPNLETRKDPERLKERV
jgi:molybdenum cofactor cytidylyltransferase